MTGKAPRRPAWAIATLLLALAAAVRLASLSSLPPSLFRDEAEKGYNAWSIAQSGRDIAGNFLPLFINVFGVTTSAAYQYAAAPFLWLLGPTEVAVRLPAALAGLLTIVIAGVFMRRAYGQRAALCTIAFLALSPWHIAFSRWAQQGILVPLALSVALLGLQCWLGGRRWSLILVGVACGFAVYAYDVARLFVPLWLGGALVVFWRDARNRPAEVAAGIVAFAVAIAPVAWLIVTTPDSAQARFTAISIFGGGASLAESAWLFVKNYLSHWSPGFLLVHGDAELRHSAGVGQLLGVEAVALIAGAIVVARTRDRTGLVLLWGVLLFPVAASLTRVGIPHALRCIVALPLIQCLAGVGAARVLDSLDRRGWKQAPSVAALALFLSFLPMAFTYFTTYAGESAINWQFGVKESLRIARNARPTPQRIIFYRVTGAEYFSCFFERIPPSQIRARGFEGTGLEMAPWSANLDALCRQHAGTPTAFITLPMFPVPCQEGLIAVGVPGRDEPSMAVTFNYDPFQSQLTGSGDAATTAP